MNRSIRQTVLALLAALIWGLGFSAQSVASEHMGPFTFNMYRAATGFLFLLLLDLAAPKVIRGRRNIFQLERKKWKRLAAAGACCGAALFLAAFLQQLAIGDSAVGKVGFITTMYIVIVPLIGLLRGKRSTALLWTSVGVAAVGMYFLCVTEGFSVVRSDIYAFLCAVVYALHILIIDRFSAEVDGLEMSCCQFLMMAILSAVGTLLFERPTLHALGLCAGPILYAGVFAGGVAYTLQILAQKDANPTVISLLLSLESVFAALGGAVLLKERMSARELLGCGLMLAAVVLAQLPAASGASAEKREEEEHRMEAEQR